MENKKATKGKGGGKPSIFNTPLPSDEFLSNISIYLSNFLYSSFISKNVFPFQKKN